MIDYSVESNDSRILLSHQQATKFRENYHRTYRGCCIWHGWKGTGGFGLFNRNGKTFYANQIAWEHMIGKLPSGMCLIPIKCQNPACVRVDHLTLVPYETRAEQLLCWKSLKRAQRKPNIAA